MKDDMKKTINKINLLETELKKRNLIPEVNALRSLSLAFYKIATNKSILDCLFSTEFFKNIEKDKFEKQNASILNGISKIGDCKLLGSGANGVAFELKNADNSSLYVLKISKEPNSNIQLNKKFNPNFEPNIFMEGEFLISDSQNEKLYWKIMEKFNTELLQNSDIQSLIDIILIDLMQRFRDFNISLESNIINKDLLRLQPIDIYTIEDFSQFESFCESEGGPDILSNKILNSVCKDPIAENIIQELNKILSPNWFEKFIKSMLYVILTYHKNDFGSANVGIKSETGELIWFDI